VVILSLNNLADPILIIWHTDGGGNKISIIRENEDYVVVNNRVLLDYVPDKFYGITFSTPASMVEIPLRSEITVSTEYKVDYTNGLIYLHSDLEATTVTVTYYSRGIINYPASRIYTEATGLTVTETLTEKIDYLLTVGEDYSSAEAARVSAENTRIANEATREANETTREGNEYIRGVNETDRQTEWLEFTHSGDYNALEQYARFNVVKYNTSTYMCVLTPPSVGISPLNTAYWKEACVSGNGITPRGIYNGGTAYSQYDIVTYQNSLYMAKSSTTGNVPTNDTYWDLYLTLSTIDTLYLNTIADTTVETTYSGSELTTIVWKDATTTDTIRTDTFTYDSDVSTETITELRTLAGTGETLEIVSVFDLDGNFISGDSTSNV
jgi:hypothetical protein